MAFIQLGTDSQLKFKIPTKNTTNWSDQLKTDFFQKLVEHDHSGVAGKGVRIDGSGLSDDSVNQVKIRLDNDTFLRSRNAADTADVDIIGVDSSDKIVLGGQIDTLDVDVINVDVLAPIKTVSNNIVTVTTAAVNTILSIDITKSQTLEYRISFEGNTQVGTYISDTTSVSDSEDFIGTDIGAPISLVGTNLTIDTTSLGTISGVNTLTIAYLIKEI